MSKINEILSDKESMEQIKKLASMMGMSGENEAPPPPSQSLPVMRGV